MIPFVPLIWLGSTNSVFLCFAQVFSGIAWGGFNLASVNFIYDSSESKSRSKYIAFYNALTGVALCLGALIGGYIIPILPPIFGNQILTLFVVSGVMRGLVAIFFLRFIGEVRHVPKVDTVKLLLGKVHVPTDKR